MPTAISVTIGVSQAMPVPSGALMRSYPFHTNATLWRKVHSRVKNSRMRPTRRWRATIPGADRRLGRATEINIGWSKPLVGHGISGTNRPASELDAS